MPVGKHTDPKVKNQVITAIRDEGMPVSEAAKKYGVHPKTIYGWLRSGVVDGNANLVLELNRLRKENEQLYNLLGRATAELKRPKK